MHLFDRFKTRYTQHRRYRQTLAELRALSRRDLDDIGVSPYDVRRIARDAARRPGVA